MSFTTYRTATTEDETRLLEAARKFHRDYLEARNCPVYDEDNRPMDLVMEVEYEIDDAEDAARLRAIWNKRLARALRVDSARGGLGIAWGYVGRAIE